MLRNLDLKALLETGERHYVWEEAGAEERAMYLAASPTWWFLGRVADDEPFMAGLRDTRSGAITYDQFAARYQRRGRRGHAVLVDLAEHATSRARADREIKRWILQVGSFGYGVGAATGGRARARHDHRRGAATESLLRIGARRCLYPSCGAFLSVYAAGSSSYCSQHSELERGFSDEAAKAHDARMRPVSELLSEVGDFCGLGRR